MRFTMCSLLAVLALSNVRGQEQDTRMIWDSGFRKQRPAAPATSAPKKDRDLQYESSASKPVTSQQRAPIFGLTVWFMRPPHEGEKDVPRLLVQPPRAKPMEGVLERLRPGEHLRNGDHVRLSLEVPRDGYLYVINRERYSDGTASPPQLIFPAKNLNQGSNRVKPGRVVDIPGDSDDPNLLNVKSLGQKQVGEELLVLVAPAPLAGVEPGEREVRLDAALVSRWERDWAVAAERIDLSKGTPQVWTASEKAAGNQERLLTQGDPMPQSIYHASAGAGRPQLVKLVLEVR